MPISQSTAFSPTVRPPGKSAYLPQLDGLRGIAILSVLIHHFEVHLPVWIDWGPIGVRTFFLLSGYLITLSLWKMMARAEGNGGYWRGIGAYHIRRFLRLAPALYLMIAIGCVMGLDYFWDGLGWHLAFLTNFYTLIHNEWPGAVSHLWSLSLQEQFYVVWPLVILLVPRRYLPWALLGIMASAFAFRFWAFSVDASPFVRWLMLPAVMDSFALGALIACWKTSDRPIPLATGWTGLAVGLAAIGCYVIARFMRYATEITPWFGMMDTFENVFLGWILLRTIQGWGGVVGRIFENRVLVYLGKISYGLFVFHSLVHVVLTPWLDRIGLTLPGHGWERSAILIPVCIGIAAISWRWIEQPLGQWAHRRVSRAGKAPASTPA